MTLRISDVGEKRLIREFILPRINPQFDGSGAGDDCAVMDVDPGYSLVCSTDRVPADLISFRLGIIDFFGLGRYLGVLNLSDIAAAGGRPTGILFNAGVYGNLPISDFMALLEGLTTITEGQGARVIGGDISWSEDLSLSATSLGVVEKGRSLTRRGARPGDTVFVSRMIGLTPSAFLYYLHKSDRPRPALNEEILRRQFTAIEPMVELGQRLARSQICSACMDNTDGIWESFSEIGLQSGVKIVLKEALLKVPAIVQTIAEWAQLDMIVAALSGGADFSLVGTLRGQLSEDEARAALGFPIHIVGYVDAGSGVWLQSLRETLTEIQVPGWNYFVPNKSTSAG
jgi:thiamine-monophosphate kinase